MSFELAMLAASCVLCLVQIVISSHAASLQRGYRWTASSRDTEVPPLTGVAGRFDRALRNFLETFTVFVAAGFLVHVLGRESALSEWGAGLYFSTSLLYAAGVPLLRSLVWKPRSLELSFFCSRRSGPCSARIPTAAFRLRTDHRCGTKRQILNASWGALRLGNQVIGIDDARESNMPDVGRRSCLYGVGVVAHYCARVAIARNEDHIIDARAPSSEQRHSRSPQRAGRFQMAGACLRPGRPGPLRPRRHGFRWGFHRGSWSWPASFPKIRGSQRIEFADEPPHC
jgi:uncharacterized MAPEG superfamily protein